MNKEVIVWIVSTLLYTGAFACLFFSITSYFAHKPIHLFHKNFRNIEINDWKSFNHAHAKVLLVHAVLFLCSGSILLFHMQIGIYFIIGSFLYTCIIAPILFSYIQKQYTRPLIQSFMFSTSKNHTTNRYNFYQQKTYVEAYEYLSIQGKENIIQAKLKKNTLLKILDYIEDNAIEDWNGFNQEIGETGKGVYWQIKIVYQNGDTLFARGKDSYPIHGKEIIEGLNELVNKQFMHMKKSD